MEKSLLGRKNVYVRSLASRGAHGAVAPQTRNVARLLELTEAFDVVIIETVGAGQSEVAIAELADTVMLVTVPGLGDAVQAIKAGFLEVADIVVVNKADRPDSPETIRHLRMNLDHEQEVMPTIATTSEGVAELRAALDARWEQITSGAGDLSELRAGKFAQEATMLAEAWTKACAAGVSVDAAEGYSKAVKRILEEAAARWKME
jgi:LAO/AO transport system kinase